MKEYAEMNKNLKNAKITIKKIELDLNELIKEAKGTPRGEDHVDHYKDVLSKVEEVARDLTDLGEQMKETAPLVDTFIELLEEEKERQERGIVA